MVRRNSMQLLNLLRLSQYSSADFTSSNPLQLISPFTPLCDTTAILMVPKSSLAL